jgi:pimeloyl-ACP methyl ester carboxylesterase
MPPVPRASGFRSPGARAAYCRIYDEAVAQAPVPVEESDVEGRDGVTHVLTAGNPSNPPLVALHAKAFSSTMWLPLLPALAAQHRVHLLDAVGDLNKSVARRVLSSPARVAAWIDETLDALSIDRCALAGASIGAWMAAHYSMAHPARVERLAMVGPAGLVSRQHLSWLISAIFVAGVRPTAARLERFVDSMAMPVTAPRLRDDPWRCVVQQFVVGTQTYRSRLGEPLPRPARLERLAAAQFPVLVLVGRQETLHDGPRMAARFRERVPRARVEVVDQANHLLVMDQTERAGELLREFLEPGGPAGRDSAP